MTDRQRRPLVYVKPPRTVVCQRCGEPFDVPPSVSRVACCPPCRPLVRREWDRAAYAQERASRPPAPPKPAKPTKPEPPVKVRRPQPPLHETSCPVRYVACRWCGELACVRSGRAWYHPRCRDAADRASSRQWNADHREDRNDLATIIAWGADKQAESRAMATAHGAAWTEDEDAVLLELASAPIMDSCRALGRTLKAVQARRTKLRRRGLLD